MQTHTHRPAAGIADQPMLLLRHLRGDLSEEDKEAYAHLVEERERQKKEAAKRRRREGNAERGKRSKRCLEKECAECKVSKGLQDFTKTQWKDEAGKCKECKIPKRRLEKECAECKVSKRLKDFTRGQWNDEKGKCRECHTFLYGY